MLKVGAYRLMLLLTLDFSLYPLLRITPFLHCLIELLLPSLFLEDPVLVLKPDLLHFLFLHVSSWDIAKEIRLSLKSILRLKLDWLPSRIEVLEWMRSD